MIRISDPARIGQTLGRLRITDGWGRRELARHLAAITGREEDTLTLNLWRWDTLRAVPTLDIGLPPYLLALGVDLALVPRLEEA